MDPNQLANSESSRPEAQDEAQTPLTENAELDREYGCKYCTKKFSNKQALGGHYNAHKLERTLEKTARELHDNRFNYYVTNGSPYRGRYVGSYNRSHDLLERSVFNNFPYNRPQQRMHIGNNARYGMPFSPYAPAHHTHGVNNVYPGWVAPKPRVPQFRGQGTLYAHNQGTNVRFSNNGMGDASLSSRPVHPDLSVYAAQRNRGGMNGSGSSQRDEDESGLDLSLKL